MYRANADKSFALGTGHALNASGQQHGDQLELQLVQFATADGNKTFDVDVIRDTVWATERQIADVFQTDPSTVATHIRSVFEQEELDETACSRAADIKDVRGLKTQARHYNLDVILAVGYRVSTAKATRFRRWATQALRSYVVDGYCVTEDCMRDKAASTLLVQRLEALRAAEKNIYDSVRAFFKESAHDYYPNSAACQSFDELLQAKFIFAITSMQPSELLSTRADHEQHNMGLQTFAGRVPTMDDAKLSKNYLDRNELYQLHVLCEQFLLYVKSLAVRGKKMTMQDLLAKLDDLLRVADYPVFQGYKDFYQDKAVRHAQAEYAMFVMRENKAQRSLRNVSQLPTGLT